MRVLHFPKWLWNERFEIRHYPDDHLRFTVVLFHQEYPGVEYTGFSVSLAEAANLARKHREAMTK